MQHQNRQLAAILFTDIVGYTAMMQQDEQNSVAVTRHYLAVLNKCVEIHHGQILNDYGDGSLCTFPSILDALHCAIEVQQQLQTEPKVPMRIGLHLGEVFFEGNKVMGDSVNVASRIQSLGQANTILFSKEIFDKIKNQPQFKSVSLGKFEFKNVDEPMEIFALANDGLIVPAKEQMSGKLKEIQKKSSLRKWIITTAIVALLIAAFFIYKNFYSSSGFTGEKSIAVLPFENNGTDKSEDYINDGITQDIINNLSKISSLQKVIGWFSVRGFKNSNKSLKQIADELGVAAVLTGTIQRNAGNIRIITELIDVSTNKIIWHEDYNYSSKDLLSIQSNLAGEIVNALQASLTPEEKKELSKHYTENVEAYKFYRKGRYFWDQRSKESYESAEMYYKKAIELDPDYAIAYAGLADLYTFNQKGLTQIEAIPIAREYAMKALSLDSTLTEAQTTIAFIQFQYDYNFHDSKLAFQKIIHDNPNYPTAHLYYGNVLVYTGNIQEGLNENKKALSLDPLSTVLNMVLGKNYYYAREYDSAIAQLQKTLLLNPNFKSGNVILGLAFLQKKLYAKAIDAFSKVPPLSTDQGNSGLIMLSYSYALTEDITAAKTTLEKVPNEYRIAWPYFLSYVYLSMGDTDTALTQLEYAYKLHSLGMVFLKTEPALDPIRNEPRFKALMKMMNFE